jgi:hypothetical protein
MFIIKNKNFIKINVLVNKSNVLLKENGFFNFLSDSNYAFTLMSNLSSWLKLSFKNKKDMLIKAQNMVIMECMSENVLSVLQNNSDLIMWGLKTIGLLGLGVGTSYALYKRRSVSKEKNDNNDDPPNISSENSKFVDNRENMNSVDEAANNNDGCSKDEFSNIESLDPLNIFKSLEDKLDNYNGRGSNEEFFGEEYINLILDFRKEMWSSGTKDISKFLQDFNIGKAVEFFSISPGPYTENVENLINMEGAIEYFSLFRLSEFTIEGIQTFDYGTFRNLFLAASALTLVKMIKDGNLPKDLYSMMDRLSSVKKINFLSRFSIQDYFRLFKESFLSILFNKGLNSFYCPKENGVRIIEKVVFNKTNMKLFFQYEKSLDLMNENLYFCTRRASRASRAYWLDSEHSISHALDYSSNPAFGYYFIKNYWDNAKKFDHGKFYVDNTARKLNTELPVVSDPHAKKSPYIICLWDYAMSLKNLIHDISTLRERPKLELITYIPHLLKYYNNLLRSLA